MWKSGARVLQDQKDKIGRQLRAGEAPNWPPFVIEASFGGEGRYLFRFVE
jgi:hypothetical protein